MRGCLLVVVAGGCDGVGVQRVERRLVWPAVAGVGDWHDRDGVCGSWFGGRQDRARIERDTEDDYEYGQRRRGEEDGEKAPGRATMEERSGREEVEMNGGKEARGGVEGRKEGFTGEEDEIQQGREVVVEEGAEEEEMLNVES